MDSFDTNSNLTDPSSESTETELGHTDKIVGILSEPKSTFERTSHFPPKTIDWFLPVALLLLVIAITNIVMMSNPEIKMQAQEKQIEKMRKNLDEAVAKGSMTRAQADEQINTFQDRMSAMGPGITIVISTLSIFIGGFIFFIIMTGIYFLFAKAIFKGDGTFASALVACGLTAYITIIQIIVAAILAMLFNRLMQDTSLATLLNADRSTILGWLEAKIDPISIWAYIALSIGLAKMFKSSSTQKYYAAVFGIWIIGSLVFFLLAKAVPFLGFFTGS